MRCWGLARGFRSRSSRVQVQEGPVEGYEAAGHQNDEDTLSFRLDASPEFEKGGKNGGLYLENPRENRYDLQADIELEDGTVVYSSPVLEPDSHIDTVDLDEELEDGTYPAQARLFAVDPESRSHCGLCAPAH